VCKYSYGEDTKNSFDSGRMIAELGKNKNGLYVFGTLGIYKKKQTCPLEPKIGVSTSPPDWGGGRGKTALKKCIVKGEKVTRCVGALETTCRTCFVPVP
jgi:hypothetical protein